MPVAAGVNKQLGLSNEIFALGDSLVLTVLGQVSFMPLLVLAARICPEVDTRLPCARVGHMSGTCQAPARHLLDCQLAACVPAGYSRQPLLSGDCVPGRGIVCVRYLCACRMLLRPHLVQRMRILRYSGQCRQCHHALQWHWCLETLTGPAKW